MGQAHGRSLARVEPIYLKRPSPSHLAILGGNLCGRRMKGTTNWAPGNWRKLVFSCPSVTLLPLQDPKLYSVGDL